MGALVTVMVSPQLKEGCAVTQNAAAALVAEGWTAPAYHELWEPECTVSA